MLSVSGLTAGFSGRDIFSGLNFQITAKDRVGLIGKNGAGKSTLLKLVYGLMAPTEGSIVFQPNITVGYLPQEIKVNSEKTIVDEAKTAFDHILNLEKEIKEIEVQLAERTDYESQSYLDLITRLTELHEKLGLHDASDIDSKTERVLKGLGFKPADFKRSIKEFSGGWQMRVELAKILLSMPDLILLDEPTNHLDIDSIMWLEDFFINYPGAMMMVSHDKMFLDNVTNRTLEIVNRKMYDYKANYSKFLQIREERIQIQLASKKNQDQYIKQQERFIERFKAKNTKAKQAQSKQKQLEKVERIEIDDVETSAIKINFPPAPRSGDKVLIAKELSKHYEEKKVFNHAEFEILRGEKVAFVGKNGMGKTTMVKLINGLKPTMGEINLGHNVKLGYYAQIQENTLNAEETVFETLDNIATDEWRNVSRLRGLLGAFLFGAEEIDKKVKVLSGGEKSRLAIAKLLLDPYNLLVLDEPTNHLDMSSKEILKNALNNYDGTLIIVSHDRDFLQGLTNKTYEFIDGKVKEHLGTIDEFLDKKKHENFRSFELDNQKKQAEQKAKKEKQEKPSEQKVDYQAKKELEKEIRQLKKDVNNTEKKVEEKEGELAELEEKMLNPDLMNDPEKSKQLAFQHGNIQKELDQFLSRWEKQLESLSALEDQLSNQFAV